MRRIIRRKRKSQAREPINWTKATSHPDDYRVSQHEAAKRQHERRYGESADERDGRVCAFVNVGGAGVIEIGHDNRRSDPTRQAIAWDPKAKQWIDAPLVLGPQAKPTLSKQAHEVRQGIRAELAVNGGWQTVGRR